jgi:site-specific DNA-methyltransferase (adenine-specific)
MTFRKEVLADGIELFNADCREVLPTLGKVSHIISDPPYEAVMQNKWGVLSRNAPSSHVRHEEINFDAVDDMRPDVAIKAVAACDGWLLLFCMAEGVRAWRDAIEAAGARYKRAMVWIKPDAMPQFNGQGPSVGFEMLVSAWCGAGHSRWNGGGRPGTFTHNKNTPGGSVHPTQKPLPLMFELVELFSFKGDTVCDPFMGSGTTGVAAAQRGRSFIGIEQDARYFDVACQRVSAALKQPDFFIEKPKPLKQEAMPL